MSRSRRAPAPITPPSSAAPAPSPGAATETAPDTAAVASAGPDSVAPPVIPTPDGATLQSLDTQTVADPPPGGEHEQLPTLDSVTGEPVPPLMGLARLGALALGDADPATLGLGDASAARMEEASQTALDQIALENSRALESGLTLTPDAALAAAQDPSTQDEEEDPERDPDLDEDAMAWQRERLERATVMGLPVLFREYNRRFNGEAVTPAIITRVHEGLLVNLMILPDGDVPYPRLNVPYEAELDPNGLGRAWTHLAFFT